MHGRRGMLAKESVVRESPLMVVSEVQEIGGKPGDVNTVLSLATSIEIAWLHELFPMDMHTETRVLLDTISMRVRADDVLRFRDLALTVRRVEPPPSDAAAQLLAEEVVAGRLRLSKWDHAVEQWILRLIDWPSGARSLVFRRFALKTGGTSSNSCVMERWDTRISRTGR